MGEVAAKLALLEVLDRDGSVRHSVSVSAWPLRVGRALDNDLVLDDPHIAAHHFQVEADERGAVAVVVGESLNGVQLGTQHLVSEHLAAGARHAVGDKPLALAVGRLHLRLRLASHALAPEQPLLATRSLSQGMGTLVVAAVLVALALVFGVYLDTDPDGFGRALGTLAISAVGALLGWCGLWTLLSKIFTRQGHFAWHLRVLLIALLAWELVSLGGTLLAFAMSWPWASDFNFMPSYAILGAMLYFHLQAVEPHRLHLTRAMSVASVVVGIAVSLWFNWQAGDRFGSELYMNHLFPPALRVAKPLEMPEFMKGVADMQATLDDKAKKVEGDE